MTLAADLVNGIHRQYTILHLYVIESISFYNLIYLKTKYYVDIIFRF